MAIPVIEVIKRASDILQDDQHVRWTVPELLRWINDAAREVVLYRPSSHAVTNVIALKSGTYQEIPVGGTQLLDVIRNMGTDGKRPGSVVRRTDRSLLSDQDPNWHSMSPGNAIYHYTVDDRNPKGFYVWPAAREGMHVEMLYASLPDAVMTDKGVLDMGQEYMNPIVSYVVFRAFGKDSEYAQGGVAAAHYQAFATSMGISGQSAASESANTESV